MSIVGALIGLTAMSGAWLVASVVRGPRRRVRRLHRPPRPIGLVLGCVAAGLVGALLTAAVTSLAILALLSGAVAAAVPFMVARRREARRKDVLRGAWPDAIDVLASGVRAGLSLPEALGDLGRAGPVPLRDHFRAFDIEYRATGSFDGSLALLRDRLSDPVPDRVIDALAMTREFGGRDLGRVLRTLSEQLRRDARTRGEILARQSWTVSAARMAIAAPWVTLILLCTRPQVAVAYASAAGAAVLACAAGMSVIAYAAMRRIARLPMDERARR